MKYSEKRAREKRKQVGERIKGLIEMIVVSWKVVDKGGRIENIINREYYK